jgi:ketosteroid isomerase-like protein
MTSCYLHSQRFKLALFACLALLLVASACTTPSAPDTRKADEAALRELDAQWAKSAQANDLDGTVAYYSDDATLLPPNAPMAKDKQAIRAMWAELLVPGNSLTWQATKVEVAKSGDLAFIMGTYQLSMKGPEGQPLNDTGKFVEVWEKQPDGKWKVGTDIFNSDLPAAPAPAPAATKK